MSKAHRGKGIRDLFARGRGTCPVCGAGGIKLLYEAGEQKIKVCKPCKAAIKHGKKSVPVKAATAAE
jgi:RNA polymerase subunit RPABC4/transcription elongation factor Spt4